MFALSRLSALCLPLMLAPGVALAQAHHEHGAPPEQLGQVVFPTSCKADAQHRIERAVALLHSFWWEETLTAFREIVAADPDCIIAYWGQAMALRGNPMAGPAVPAALPQGQDVVRAGMAIVGGTPRERDYLQAIGTYFLNYDAVGHAGRMLAYEQKMKEITERYPDDVEAKIFYGIAAAANASTADTTFARQRAIGQMLEPLFREHPGHPGLAHYLIHSYDSPVLAPLGLDAARRYAEIAPAVPHAQHMPSHIFVRLGLWDETVAANQRSYDAALSYAAGHHPGSVDYDAFHAQDYMVYGYLQSGRDEAARAVIAQARSATMAGPAHFVTDYALAAMPARYALERSQWVDAAALELRPGAPAAEAITRFARALGAARSGDIVRAREELAVLEQIRTTLAGSGNRYWATVAEIKLTAAAAWVTLATGDTAGALGQAHTAARLEDVTDKHPVTPGEVLPAREMLGDMLLATGRAAEARQAYEAVLEREPNRARAIFGAARAAERAGDVEGARQHYRAFLEMMAEGDGTRPEVEVARRAVGP